MGTIDKIEKLEEKVNKAFDKTVNGATSNASDREKAKKQYKKFSGQLEKLLLKVENSDRLKEEWENRYGCDFE